MYNPKLLTMAYKPRTSSEINLNRIEVGLKQLEKGLAKPRDLQLNNRFDRLKKDNIGMWEELYPKYIQIVKVCNTF